MSIVIQDKVLHEKLGEIMQAGWFPIPNYHGYRGTGTPGLILEELLGVDGGNHDLPDAGKWEIKFHGGSSPITLFHKEAQPRGHLEEMVSHYGWADDEGRTSFRHTIWGQSPLGFDVQRGGDDKIVVLNPQHPDIVVPYWLNDTLMNAFIQKLRRVIVVSGRKKGKQVKYDSATLFWEPRTSEFIDAIADGMIAIDFDARTKSNSREVDKGKLRNHGTKFRIKYKDPPRIYREMREF